MRTALLTSIAYLCGLTAFTWTACAPPASADSMPSYAHPNNQQLIRGRIDSVDGTWQISVLDDSNGYIDKIGLHQGTVINPTGITLQPGMRVTIFGYPAGAVFEANKIDTPYDRPAYNPLWYPYVWYPPYRCCYPGYGGPFGNVGIGINVNERFGGDSHRGHHH